MTYKLSVLLTESFANRKFLSISGRKLTRETDRYSKKMSYNIFCICYRVLLYTELLVLIKSDEKLSVGCSWCNDTICNDS